MFRFFKLYRNAAPTPNSKAVQKMGAAKQPPSTL